MFRSSETFRFSEIFGFSDLFQRFFSFWLISLSLHFAWGLGILWLRLVVCKPWFYTSVFMREEVTVLVTTPDGCSRSPTGWWRRALTVVTTRTPCPLEGVLGEGEERGTPLQSVVGAVLTPLTLRTTTTLTAPWSGKCRPPGLPIKGTSGPCSGHSTWTPWTMSGTVSPQFYNSCALHLV